ncbi:hypothetical protein IM792_16255 [Mucilaginibacter sp. JRF]|uniref:hypothetical protein n=1 Tax=Mucilaginibacter sp. JRF TaxID=2780088 RepID=UPI0018825254|nr:hypothetical protein [Mucilaginibacter sp. JRF]MBE9586006.1 hypothetical protein [Mucilaginibacter sp. JRF]
MLTIAKGDALINEVVNDKSFSKEVRDFAKEVIEHGKLSKEETDFIETLDKAELINLRVKSLQRFSDESVGELDLTTKVLRRDKNCLQ